MDYKLKYIKYKFKYLQLKGSGKRPKDESDDIVPQKKIPYKITNYYNDDYIRSIAEVIPFGKLKDKVTNHGLGSGIYGFIDTSKAITYNTDGNTPKEFELFNPLILKDNAMTEDGEDSSDNSRLTELSNLLTRTCYEIYTNNNDTNNIDEEYIKQVLAEDYIYDILVKRDFKITDDYSPTLETIVKAIKDFISDYTALNDIIEFKEENYVYMPINYLLHDDGYYGIYNEGGDSGNRGSVKYYFDGSYPSRGFPVDFKKREPMKGKLFFQGKLLEKKNY